MNSSRRDFLRNLGLSAAGLSLASTVLAQKALRSSSSNIAPKYLTLLEYEIVSIIADTLLPHTSDSPSATDVFVQDFVDRCTGEYLTPEQSNTLRSGLNQIDEDCQRLTQRSFVYASSSEQMQVILGTSNSGESESIKFMTGLREYIIVGYFTSKEVGANVLNFQPVPGAYNPCIDLTQIKNAHWTHSK